MRRIRTVVVTGASAGVGRAVARRFAEGGARIGLLARGRERLEAAAREVRELGGEALVLSADVADSAAVDAAAERVERELGPIDVWINNAMATILAPFVEIAPEEFRRVTEVTYLGQVHGTMAALRYMRPRDRGVIVQVGSALAYRSIPLQSPYCGAKHAVAGFTESLRSELIHEGSSIELTMVHLPAVNTPQFDWSRNKMGRRHQPVPPIFQPEVAADAIHFAAHHPRRELWVGGPTVQAILADKIVPGLLDRYLAGSGYSGQLTDEREGDRPDNLFSPVEGGYAAHGRFDDSASARSPMLALAKNRDAIAAGAAVLIGALGVLGLRRRLDGRR